MTRELTRKFGVLSGRTGIRIHHIWVMYGLSMGYISIYIHDVLILILGQMNPNLLHDSSAPSIDQEQLHRLRFGAQVPWTEPYPMSTRWHRPKFQNLGVMFKCSSNCKIFEQNDIIDIIWSFINTLSTIPSDTWGLARPLRAVSFEDLSPRWPEFPAQIFISTAVGRPWR